MIRILLIILIFFIQNFAHSEEIKWKEKGFNTTDAYIQEYYRGSKKVNTNGKLKEYNISHFHTFPNKKKKNKKNWFCRDWTINEQYNDNKYLSKSYSLNYCLPCLDKSSGDLCSYPYLQFEFKSSLHDKIYNNENKRVLEFLDDGTNKIQLWINLGSRERINIIRQKVISKDNKTFPIYVSKILKYNTKYREIPTKTSKPRFAKGQEGINLMRVFDRVSRKAIDAIENKNELKLREKDIKTIMSIEPSATIIKYQTRH